MSSEFFFMGRKKKKRSELIAGWKFRNVTIEMYGNAHVTPRLWTAIGSCFPVLWSRGEARFVFDETDDGAKRWSIFFGPAAGEDFDDWVMVSHDEDEFLMGLFEYCYAGKLPAHDIVCDLIGSIT